MVRFPPEKEPLREIKYPAGYPSGNGTKIAVVFPSELFAAIITMAKRENKSFNEMVVELCRVGKLDLEESDALEITS